MKILKNNENFKGCDFVVKLDKSRKNTKIKILQITVFCEFFCIGKGLLKGIFLVNSRKSQLMSKAKYLGKALVG